MGRRDAHLARYCADFITDLNIARGVRTFFSHFSEILKNNYTHAYHFFQTIFSPSPILDSRETPNRKHAFSASSFKRLESQMFSMFSSDQPTDPEKIQIITAHCGNASIPANRCHADQLFPPNLKI